MQWRAKCGCFFEDDERMRSEHYSVLSAAEHQLQQQTFQKYDKDAITNEYKCWSRQKRAYVELNTGDWVFIRKGEFAGAEGKVIAKHRQGIAVDCYLNKKDLKTETGGRLSTTLSLGTFSVNEDLDVVLGKAIADAVRRQTGEFRLRKNPAAEKKTSFTEPPFIKLGIPLSTKHAETEDAHRQQKNKRKRTEEPGEDEKGIIKWPEQLNFLNSIRHALRKDQPLSADMKQSLQTVNRAHKATITKALPDGEGLFFWHEIMRLRKKHKSESEPTQEKENSESNTIEPGRTFTAVQMAALQELREKSFAFIAALDNLFAAASVTSDQKQTRHLKTPSRDFPAAHEADFRCPQCQMDFNGKKKNRIRDYDRHMNKRKQEGICPSS
jgi:hypothetical protein